MELSFVSQTESFLILGHSSVLRISIEGTSSAAKSQSSSFSQLIDLYLKGETLPALDLSDCGGLRVLRVYGASLCSSLQLSGCHHLQELQCLGMGGAKELDLSSCTSLERLIFRGSSLPYLDVSCCPLLYHIDVSDSMLLAKLKIARTCDKLWSISFRNCPLLEGIETGTVAQTLKL